jgi:hypothetical protein
VGVKDPRGGPTLQAMPSGLVNRSLIKIAGRVPGVRRIPVVALLSAAEVAVLAREHLQRLSPAERRRLVALVKVGRGRKDRLTARERDELEALVAKLEPRRLFGDAAGKLSPVPIPHRLLYGRRR